MDAGGLHGRGNLYERSTSHILCERRIKIALLVLPFIIFTNFIATSDATMEGELPFFELADASHSLNQAPNNVGLIDSKKTDDARSNLSENSINNKNDPKAGAATSYNNSGPNGNVNEMSYNNKSKSPNGESSDDIFSEVTATSRTAQIPVDNVLLNETSSPSEIRHSDNFDSATLSSIGNDSSDAHQFTISPVGEINSTQNSPHEHLVDSCLLRLRDDSLRQLVVDLTTDEETKLVEYNLIVLNQTDQVLKGIVDVGKDEKIVKWTYRGNRWTRVTNGYGQTMISLAFNYEVLSLMTLSFGIERLDIELLEEPAGCMENLTKAERRLAVLDIIMRDWDTDGHITVREGSASVCQEIIEEVNGKALFVDHCCYLESESNEIRCKTMFPNKWLQILDALLLIFVVVVYVFGAHFVPSWMYSSALDSINYVVPLKEPLHKTMVVCQDEVSKGVIARNTIDLRSNSDFTLCRKVVAELPTERVIPILVSQFNIKVNYRKLLTENYVPVSLLECLSKALFLCKLKELSAFKDCCDANISGTCVTTTQHRPWISICEVIGRMLIVILLPFPFYIRLILYYMFENSEINERHAAADEIGIPAHYNYRIIQHLTPTHPIFLVAYTLYFCIGFQIAYLGKNETRFQAAVVDSFADLKQLSGLRAMRMLVRNMLYPFRKFGMFGFLLAPIMWIVFVPLSLAVCFLYCLPVAFLTSRIMYHILKQSSHSQRRVFSQSFESFEAENILHSFSKNRKREKLASFWECYLEKQKTVFNIIATVISLLTLYSVLLVCGEVAAYFGELVSFTLMGLIVNASKVIKYGSLIFLVVIYCIDTYSNVNKKYIKLNKALFSEIKGRVKGLDALTSLPSYLQRNTGFKSSEASAQGDHELPDDLARRKHHWHINDLLLFIDREDTPRIPKKIFEDSCLIKVSGSPGPVYRSLLQASGRFVLIILFLLFVFIVVMSFGDVYKVSSTNQMMATLAGGFMPFILSKMLKPVSSDVETNLLSYKTKLEEILDNFYQVWPMNDFIFNVNAAQNDTTHLEVNQEPFSGSNKMAERNQESSKISAVNFYIADPLDMNQTRAAGVEAETEPNENGLEKKNFSAEKRGTFCRDLTNPLIDISDVEAVIDSLVLESAIGKTVDVAILISEQYKKWDFSMSDASDTDSVREYIVDQVQFIRQHDDIEKKSLGELSTMV